jgi:Coenzyme PQQ synthesis protein D (PqqD)
MKGKALNAKPLARKQGLVIKELLDEVLVYDLDRDRAHCLNLTAALVWRRCDGKNTTGQIARTMEEQFGGPIDEKVVWFALDQLAGKHLLDRQPGLPPAMRGDQSSRDDPITRNCRRGCTAVGDIDYRAHTCTGGDLHWNERRLRDFGTMLYGSVLPGFTRKSDLSAIECCH